MHKNKTFTTDEFVAKARETHGDKYDYSKVEYVKSHNKVIIICPKHGEFSQTPNKHLDNRGCPDCGVERGAERRRKTQEEFIKEAAVVHKDKYSYEKTNYVGDAEPVTIICPTHGEFQQTPSNHLQGRGCVCCGSELSGFKQAFTKDEFIAYAHKVHDNKYDYSKVVYERSQDKVTIICSKHGDFSQLANGHLRGKGCPTCGVEARAEKKRVIGLRVFFTESKKAHGDRYDYSQVQYQSMHQKVVIVCSIHGPFKQEPNSHKTGCGCPKCKQTTGEKAITSWLENENIIYEAQKKFTRSKINRSRFDFGVKHHNFTGLVEFHGGQHYHPCHFGSKKKYAKYKKLIQNIRRDNLKFSFCRTHKLPLLLIPYWDIDRIPEILDDVFSGHTPTFTEPPEIVKKHVLMRKAIRDKLGITEKEVLCGLIK